MSTKTKGTLGKRRGPHGTRDNAPPKQPRSRSSRGGNPSAVRRAARRLVSALAGDDPSDASDRELTATEQVDGGPTARVVDDPDRSEETEDPEEGDRPGEAEDPEEGDQPGEAEDPEEGDRPGEAEDPEEGDADNQDTVEVDAGAGDRDVGKPLGPAKIRRRLVGKGKAAAKARPKRPSKSGGDARPHAKSKSGGDALPRAKSQSGGDALPRAKSQSGGDARPRDPRDSGARDNHAPHKQTAGVDVHVKMPAFDATKVTEFLNAVKHTFQLHGLHDQVRRDTLANALLSNTQASHWYDSAGQYLATYQTLADGIRARFELRNKPREVITRMREICQDGEPTAYAATFANLVTEMRTLDFVRPDQHELLLALLAKGLRPEYHNLIPWHEVHDIEDGIKRVGVLAPLGDGPRRHHIAERLQYRSAEEARANPPAPRHQPHRHDQRKPISERLEFPQRTAPSINLSADERRRRREEKLCYNCGSPTHESRDCSKRPAGNV